MHYKILNNCFSGEGDDWHGSFFYQIEQKMMYLSIMKIEILLLVLSHLWTSNAFFSKNDTKSHGFSSSFYRIGRLRGVTILIDWFLFGTVKLIGKKWERDFRLIDNL